MEDRGPRQSLPLEATVLTAVVVLGEEQTERSPVIGPWLREAVSEATHSPYEVLIAVVHSLAVDCVYLFTSWATENYLALRAYNLGRRILPLLVLAGAKLLVLCHA